MNRRARRGTRRALAILALAAAVTVGVACNPVTNNDAGQPASTTPTTAPLPAPVVGATAGFIAFGDAGSADPIQQQVADEMRQWVATSHRADALVQAGDDVYPDGDPALFGAALDAPYAAIRGPQRPLWVALGNHDVQGGFGAQQLSYLGLPALPYAKSLPGVQLLFLDANNPDALQGAWLDAQLSASGPALRVVVFHQPAYSCALHGSTPTVDAEWVPILEAHHVALVINGHDHYYERFRSAGDVTYVVTGGGGYELYGRQPGCSVPVTSQATASRHHYVGIEIVGSTLTLTAVSRTGDVLDRTTITR